MGKYEAIENDARRFNEQIYWNGMILNQPQRTVTVV